MAEASSIDPPNGSAYRHWASMQSQASTHSKLKCDVTALSMQSVSDAIMWRSREKSRKMFISAIASARWMMILPMFCLANVLVKKRGTCSIATGSLCMPHTYMYMAADHTTSSYKTLDHDQSIACSLLFEMVNLQIM